MSIYWRKLFTLPTLIYNTLSNLAWHLNGSDFSCMISQNWITFSHGKKNQKWH